MRQKSGISSRLMGHLTRMKTLTLPAHVVMVAKFLDLNNRNHTKLRPRWQRERQKHNKVNDQNNDSARASRFFCTFLCSPRITAT